MTDDRSDFIFAILMVGFALFVMVLMLISMHGCSAQGWHESRALDSKSWYNGVDKDKLGVERDY